MDVDAGTVTAFREAAMPISNAIPAPQVSHAQTSADDPGETSANDLRELNTEKKGVEGWLALFCVKMTIFSALYGIYYASESHDTTEIVATLAIASFEIYVGVSVWMISKNALRNLKIYFISAAILATIFILLGGLIGTEGTDADDLIKSGFKLLLSSIIWCLYFVRSRRVRATFGRNLFRRSQQTSSAVESNDTGSGIPAR